MGKRKEKKRKNKLFSDLLANANEENISEEIFKKKIEALARKIISSRDQIRLKRAELENKERILWKADVENLRLAARDPPVAAEDLSSKITEIDVIKKSLTAKEVYHDELIRFARSTYPKFFIKQQK